MSNTSKFRVVSVARAALSTGLLLIVGVMSMVGCSDEAMSAADAAPDDGATLDAGVDDAAVEDATVEDDWRYDGGAGDDAAAAPVDRCGPNGHAHGDHCHCDPGYFEVEGVCARPDTCEGDDPFEPDQQPASAPLWDHDWTEVSRHMCADDRDHFRIPLQKGGRLVVEAHVDSAVHQVGLQLWRPGVDPRYTSAHASTVSSNDLARLNVAISDAGEWLLRITGASGANQGPYTLTVQVVPPAEQTDAGDAP